MEIASVAAIAGFVVSYLVFFTGCLGTWAVKAKWQHETHVPVEFLWQLTLIAWGAAQLSWSLTILVLYGWRAEADHD